MSQASGTLRDEAWMRTGEERRLRSRLPLPPQPDEVKLKMNQGTTSYRTNIAAKREMALLVCTNSLARTLARKKSSDSPHKKSSDSPHKKISAIRNNKKHKLHIHTRYLVHVRCPLNEDKAVWWSQITKLPVRLSCVVVPNPRSFARAAAGAHFTTRLGVPAV